MPYLEEQQVAVCSLCDKDFHWKGGWYRAKEDNIRVLPKAFIHLKCAP